jgi:hypothetical protein
VSCIISEQPCLNLAAECSLFVQDVERRRASQRFADLCLDLSKGLVNQENAKTVCTLGRETPVPGLSRYLVRIADISVKMNYFPDCQTYSTRRDAAANRLQRR